jgi:hypothetical protein
MSRSHVQARQGDVSEKAMERKLKLLFFFAAAA